MEDSDLRGGADAELSGVLELEARLTSFVYCNGA